MNVLMNSKYQKILSCKAVSTGHEGYRSYLYYLGHDDLPLCPVYLILEDAKDFN